MRKLFQKFAILAVSIVLISALFTSCLGGDSIDIDVASVTLNETDLELNIDDEITLVATVLPDNATDQTVTWSSSDNSVVSVTEGVIKALKGGTATITASAQGIMGSCTVTVNPDVFVAGSLFDGHDGSWAKLWKNGTATSLSNIKDDNVANSSAASVFVSGADVYVAGSSPTSTLWTNSVLSELSDEMTQSKAYSVFVSGDDVYVAGYEQNGQGRVAKVWQNGVGTILSDEHNTAYATSVFVSGEDVYVAGHEKGLGPWVAKLWKNGQAENLINGTKDNYAMSVFVSGDDVYVAGYEYNGTNNVAKVWKNGEATTLSGETNDAKARSVFVSGNDIYVAGYVSDQITSKSVAIVWQIVYSTPIPTITPHHLTNGNQQAEANSVFVFGSDVYVAGKEFNGSQTVARLWKNSVAIPFFDETQATEALSIFVR